MVGKPMGPLGTSTVRSGQRRGARAPTVVDGVDAARTPPAPEAAVRKTVDVLAASLARLARTVETEVVPRLVLAHRSPQSAARARKPPVRARDIADLAAEMLRGDLVAASARVEAVRARGATLEHVGLDLMAPVARHLGQMWVDDECTYTDVTLGVWHLQGLLRSLNPVFQPGSDPARGEWRRALVVALPGEDHAFGTDLVAGFLRLSGWEVCNEPAATEDALLDRVRRDRFAIVGLSSGCSDDLPALAALIAAVRRAVRGQPVGIMVGGHIFAADPPAALRAGADVMAQDARHAVRQAEGLLAMMANRH